MAIFFIGFLIHNIFINDWKAKFSMISRNSFQKFYKWFIFSKLKNFAWISEFSLSIDWTRKIMLTLKRHFWQGLDKLLKIIAIFFNQWKMSNIFFPSYQNWSNRVSTTFEHTLVINLLHKWFGSNNVSRISFHIDKAMYKLFFNNKKQFFYKNWWKKYHASKMNLESNSQLFFQLSIIFLFDMFNPLGLAPTIQRIKILKKLRDNVWSLSDSFLR